MQGSVRKGKTEDTLLNGSNVRLNWNIESDMNVNWIKLKNFLVCTDLRINSTESSHILHHV
jgi:hypothetical protein